ncbi:phosphoribosylanthranilate isomerase [Paenibacillus sp. y28]|uniref:phosphoribosylanthranilate isomerase n=1 Tax=Paenibacillus sp. y28 TaxID=3129110 RepID=UPI003019F295
MTSASPVKVKICGIKDDATLEGLLKLDVDYIGFVFARSKRQVQPAEAAPWIKRIRAYRADASGRPLSVGVFVDTTEEELASLLQVAPLDVVQLHGGESAELCGRIKAAFPVRVFKVLSIQQTEARSEAEIDKLLAAYAGAVDTILLDTHDPVYGGGSGKTFHWDIIPLYKRIAVAHGLELIVAGGLNADNVGGLLDNFSPDGVDVSSGVETDGSKDMNKIMSFVKRVKRND